MTEAKRCYYCKEEKTKYNYTAFGLIVCDNCLAERHKLRKDTLGDTADLTYYCKRCGCALSAETEVVLGDSAYCLICADKTKEHTWTEPPPETHCLVCCKYLTAGKAARTATGWLCSKCFDRQEAARIAIEHRHKREQEEAMSSTTYLCARCGITISDETSVAFSNNKYCPVCAETIANWSASRPRYTLLPAKALALVAKVFTLGAGKHGDVSYETRTDTRAELDAALRHLYAHLGGELLDPELGTPHLAHAAARLLIALEILENA